MSDDDSRPDPAAAPRGEEKISRKRRDLLTRRTLLKDFVKASALGLAGSSLAGCAQKASEWTLQELARPHYKNLSDEQLTDLVERLEAEIFGKYKKRPTMHTTQAKPGVRYAMALDLSACIGCGRCQEACFEENNQGRDPAIKWITMLKSEHQKIWLLHDTEAYTPPLTEEDEDEYYLPVGCQQCDASPCERACPVKATWKEPDGITVVDYNWCIGCRYCMAACPYGARKFNWATPTVPKDDFNPVMHYLGNRPRMYGVVEKCTFCIQRIRLGYNSACVDACPVNARKVGDLNDPNSPVRIIVDNVKTIQLKEDLGTKPRFFYYFSGGSP